MTISEIRRANINLIADEIGRKALARKLGYSDTVYVNQLCGGHGSFGNAVSRKIEEAFGRPKGWMDVAQHGSTGSNDTAINPKPVIVWDHPDDLPKDQFVFIPYLDVKAACGPGYTPDENDEEKLKEEFGLTFTKKFIATAELASAHLVVMQASGGSMSPTIEDKMILLIDKSQNKIRDGKIYVLITNDGIRVKRLYVLSGGIKVTSDNQDWHDEFIEPEFDHLKVYGRVVWRGGGQDL